MRISWAQAMAPMFAAARSSHGAADALLEHLMTAKGLGGAGLVAQILAQDSSATDVADCFARKSAWREGARLNRFVNIVLQGHADQGRLRAVWEKTAIIHNADLQHTEETGLNIFQNATDGNGLGDRGVSDEQRQIWADKASAFKQLSAKELKALNEQDLVAAKLSANRLAGKAMNAAMRGEDPGALIAALEAFRGAANIYAVEVLDQWAWNNQALLSRGAPAIRRNATPDQLKRLKALTADAKTWDIAEKLGGAKEVPEKTPFQISMGL
jgi:hypothetical protein